MATKNSRLFIIVGLGSIGKKHAEFFFSKENQFIFIDPSSEIQKWKKDKFNFTNCYLFRSINSAKKTIKKINLPKIGIISNWGTQHYDSLIHLYNFGIKNFFIEKPISNSINSLDHLLELSKQNKIRFIGGFGWRYSEIPKKINDLSNNYLGGSPKIINFNGGAFGIVTNGIHYLDLAISIFNSYPIDVISSLKNDLINPRQKNLNFFEGSAIWNFSNKKKLIINATNHSSVRPTAEIICPKGKIRINEDMSLSIFQRDENEIKQDPRIIRLGIPNENKNLKFKPNYNTGFNKLVDTLLDEKNKNLDSNREIIATRSIIYALIASLTKKNQIINKTLPKKYYYKKWMIS
tara:strand:+ start:74 stop:1120 length:1047 start_codon:yes stop_codon:yes gene_type:complete